MSKKCNIPEGLRINGSDNIYAKITKVIFISKQMARSGLRIEAIKWLLKTVEGLSLIDAYNCVEIKEED